MDVHSEQRAGGVHDAARMMPAADNNRQAAQSTGQTTGTSGHPLAGLRILLVEDSWHVAHAYKSLLEIVGLNVVGPVGTLPDAEKLFAEQRPDIAVVDIDLHGVKSYSLIDQLIASNVPTVVVSGYEVLPLLQGRVAAILTKPVRASTLLETVRRVIAETRSPDAL